MFDARVLYLQTRISKKFYSDRSCLRKFLAHRRLHKRFQSFATDDDQKLPSKEAVNLAMEEARNWLRVGQNEGMRTFKDRVTIHFSTERLASFTLEDSANL